MNDLANSRRFEASERLSRRNAGLDRPSPRVVWASVATYVIALGGQYLVPLAAEREASFVIGRTHVLFVEAALLGLFAIHRRTANRVLFRWGMVSLVYATVSGIALARDVEVSIGSALDAYAPFVLLAFVPLGESYRTPLKLTLTALLVAIAAEVTLYATGVLSHPMAYGMQYGAVTRISTTVGSPTATGAVLFMLGAWCVDLWRFNWKGFLVAWVCALAVALTFSRGPMVMVVLTAAFVMAAWVGAGRMAKSRLMRVAVASSALGFSVAATIWIANSAGLSDAVRERLAEGTADAGRIERYSEAMDTFLEHPVFGVGTGEYYSRWRSTSESGEGPLGSTSPHNVYLLVLAESGLIGAVVFAAGLVWLLIRIARRWRYRPVGLCMVVIAAVGFATEVLYVESHVGLLLAGLFAWFDRSALEDGENLRAFGRS